MERFEIKCAISQTKEACAGGIVDFLAGLYKYQDNETKSIVRGMIDCYSEFIQNGEEEIDFDWPFEMFHRQLNLLITEEEFSIVRTYIPAHIKIIVVNQTYA